MIPLNKLVRFFCEIFLYTTMLLLVYCGNQRSNKPHKKTPNILFILADDQRFDLIHSLGNKEIITPNLDELVSKGTTFCNTYIMGAMNGAVCAPSRAMINTGRSLFDINPYEGANSTCQTPS